MSTDPSPTLLEIEDRLRADADGSVRNAILAELGVELNSVERKLATGEPPDLYRRLTAFKLALESAIDVMKTAGRTPA